MAQMIPGHMIADNNSTAECRIFDWFGADPTTRDWYVFHSLNLAKHPKFPIAESDFVVIAPRLGIFILEVKGGEVFCKNREWHFINKFGKENVKSDSNSPFVQAKNGMFAIKNYLKKQGSSTDRFESILMGTGVMFPDISFDMSEELEYDTETIFDVHDSRKVSDYIRKLSEFYQNKLDRLHVEYHLPSKQEVISVVNILRSDFDFKISFLAGMNNTQGIQKRLTDQQYMIIEANEDNDRNLVVGLAGTGKTVLAWETARYYKSQGLSVGFFCYNKNLADYLQGVMISIHDSNSLDYLGTLHSYMAKKTPVGSNGAEDEVFFRDVLPLDFIKTDINEKDKFDVIVVDEIQDLLHPNYLKSFDHILKDGIGNGRWYFFGDLSMQCLYSDSKTESLLMSYLDDVCDQYSRSTLKLNCRNTCQIHEEVAKLLSIKPNKWKKDERNLGPNIEKVIFYSEEQRTEKIKQILHQLMDVEGLPAGQISLLSFKRFENSCFYQLRKEFEISDKVDGIQNDYLKFSTVYGYKGLENSVVILGDYDEYVSNSLLYVALTRASYKIYWCMDSDAVMQYYKLFTGEAENA